MTELTALADGATTKFDALTASMKAKQRLFSFMLQQNNTIALSKEDAGDESHFFA